MTEPQTPDEGNPVTELRELWPDHLYRVGDLDEKQQYFTIRGFYWNDENDDVLGITDIPVPGEDDVDEDNVDDENSFVGLRYQDGYCADPPVRNIKEHIEDGKYVYIGTVDEKRHVIPE